MLHKIRFAFLALALLGFGFTPSSSLQAEEQNSVTVWRSVSCGCCAKWVEHLRANGFKVEMKNARSMDEIKQSVGIGQKLRSCHTAFVGDYVIEGHVPAKEIIRLLKEKPNIKGLAVPGMPLGSPGMEQEDGTKDKYDVLSFDEAGKTEIYEKY